jgi:hypothetical protein
MASPFFVAAPLLIMQSAKPNLNTGKSTKSPLCFESRFSNLESGLPLAVHPHYRGAGIGAIILMNTRIRNISDSRGKTYQETRLNAEGAPT